MAALLGSAVDGPFQYAAAAILARVERPTVATASFSSKSLSKRRIIGERTRLALAAAKARGVKLGGTNAQSIKNQKAALARAEALRPLLEELAALGSDRAIAAELNKRGVETPAGGRWHGLTVARMRARLN